MMDRERIEVTEVRFTAARTEDIATGLLGFVECVVNGALKLAGLTLRRTRRGALVLSYPARRDAAGNEHYLIRPIHDAARESLEQQVIAALGHHLEQA